MVAQDGGAVAGYVAKGPRWLLKRLGVMAVAMLSMRRYSMGVGSGGRDEGDGNEGGREESDL